MADYYPCKIFIGGPVPKRLRKKFVESIRQSDMGLDWDAEDFEPDTIDDIIAAAANSAGGNLRLFDSQASYGCNNDLEDFLRKNKIAFDRHSEAKYEYSASYVVFRPGVMDKAFVSDQDGDILVPYDGVNGLRKLLNGTSRPETRIRAALHQLRDIAPEIPELEPISFPE